MFNETISGGGTVTSSNGGTLGGTLTETGTLAFAGGSTTLASSLALSAANIVLDGGLVNLTTSLDLSASNFAETTGTLNLGGNTLTLSGADLANNYYEGPGRLNVAGATSIGGTNNSDAVSFGGSMTLVNTGTVNELNTINNFYQTFAGFTITNTAGANFNVQGDYGIGQTNYNSTTSTFTNAGTFTKASGTGIAWEDLPPELGCGSGVTCWRRLREWQEAGVWDRLHRELLRRLRSANRIDFSRVCVDSSSIPAKKGGPPRAQTQRIAASQARNGTW